MAASDSSLPSEGKISHEHHDAQKVESNLSGLKHALHGTSYQLKLGIVVCLANAKKSLDPVNGFSFAITAEDPTAGKFDDIVYTFKDGEKKGILKIQVKHKLGSPAPNITVKDFTTGDTKNPFAILKYFTSFCDQQQSITDLEGFIICTNADIDDKAKDMWKTVEPAVTDDSAISLDAYVSSLFDSIGGKYYQLDYEKLWPAEDLFGNFHQLLRKCSKRARLAKLLVEATKPNKKITYSNSLFKEYRQAILQIIDRKEASTNDAYAFTKEFLDSSFSNSMLGYEAFRQEFEDQYRKQFKIVGCVWDQLKQKQVYVSNDFLLDEKNQYSSSDSFVDDNVHESFELFCDRFRLVCGTSCEQGLDDVIADIWRSLDANYNHMAIGQRKGCLEEKVATERLFKTNFDWLMNPFAKPLHSEDIKKDFENIENTLAHIKFKGISDKLRRNVVTSPFRINQEVLKVSYLYNSAKSKSVQEVVAYDIPFGATVLSDISHLQDKTPIFLEESDFPSDSKQSKSIFSFLPLHTSCLIIICNGMNTVRVDMFTNCEVQVFIIRKPSNIQANKQVESVNLSEFRVCDLMEQSWNQFLGQSVPLCTTNILPSKIFQNNFRDLPMEEVIKIFDWGKQMEENNEILKKYREIESIYVHRSWVDEESNLEAENTWWSENPPLMLNIKEHIQEGMSIKEMTNRLKKEHSFIQMFEEPNNPEKEYETIFGDEGKKVSILFGEAGHGKSTNLTWMAWHLRNRNPSSLVVRCNLSDHCSDFKAFTQNRKNETGKVIDETEGLRMLYRLLHSSFQLEREMAEKCSKYLVLSDGKANVSEDLMANHGLSLNFSIQLLVFKEKFNAGAIVLLLDGFDEIAPHYKEIVLEFLYHFDQFTGVGKIYLTSRPYGFKMQFDKTCKDSSFFKLNPLSLQHKGSIMFKMMKVKWNNGYIYNQEVSDFYKWLCVMLLFSLSDMNDVPLNLMMAVDILGDRIYHYENINLQLASKTFIRELFETILHLSKASFIVEEFVKVKIRHRLYDKNGGDRNVADKPDEIERFEKAIYELKLLHGLVALWVLLNENELHIILSEDEKRQTRDYMKKINEGSEKTGIVHANQSGVPTFIHRTFAEYLAAWWIVQRRMEGKQLDGKYMYRFKVNDVLAEGVFEMYMNGVTCDNHKELRENIDAILATSHPLHVAIIEGDWEIVASLLSTNPKLLYEQDDEKRTPLHLIALYYDFENDWPHFLPDCIESDLINAKDKLFGWTALDYAFNRGKPQLIYYLLHHGASIDVDVLYEQVESASWGEHGVAATYARYVMGYLSSAVIAYKSHNAYKMMKQFCDKVVSYLANETSCYNGRLRARFNDEELSIMNDSIKYDSVWMLKSVIQRGPIRKFFSSRLILFYLDEMFKNNSILTVKYFMEKKPYILQKHLWKFVIYAALNDYKIEFKYFFDLYCSQLKIKDYKPCSIQSDKPYLINFLKSGTVNDVYAIIKNMGWAKLPGIVVHENILSLLIICVATVRPSMLRYVIKSSKLSLSDSTIFSLAMTTDNLFSKIRHVKAIKPSKAYEFLLDLAPNVSDSDATKMLRLAITSNCFQFPKYLIERYSIDFQAVDELKGWNVFHLCVSNQRSFSAMTSGCYDSSYVEANKTDLFRYMQAKTTEMDCFGIFDKKGRSILHLAMENEQREIVKFIVARKLGLNDFKEIRNLNIDAIPNITFCYHAIKEISKSVGDKWCRDELCMLATQIAKIALATVEQEPNNGRLLLLEDAKKLYEMARIRRFLFLMYYLHREFPDEIPPPIYDAGWLVCTVSSLYSTDLLVVTKWLLNPNDMEQQDNLYEFFEKCEAQGFDVRSINLEKLVNQIETILSANRSVEEVCKLKLLALAVCLKHELMIKHLCETLNVKIDWKVLVDIMQLAHQSHIETCAFDATDFVPIYRYLLERTSNLGEIDAEGRNVLHLATQYGLGCMVKFLIKHNMVNVMTVNEQNGWNIFHYYASIDYFWKCCFTKNDQLLLCITKRVLEITSDGFPFSALTESLQNKIKELCFNSSEGKTSVLHVALEAGHIGMAEYITECRLGINRIDKHEIWNPEDGSNLIECYDDLSQIPAHFQFNEYYDSFLHCVAKLIHRFSPENSDLITEQENVEDHIVKDVCQSAIKYRSVATLENLMIAYEVQMNQTLTRSTSNELLACMTECIRRNRSRMFIVLISHYRILQGIQPKVEVEFEDEENCHIDADPFDEKKIQWPIINKFSQNVPINRRYLILLILSGAYGRLSMTRFLVEMLQLEVNKSLILLMMKVLEALWDENCKTATPVYEYLASKCKRTPNLLHLCIQAECYNMLEYLITEKKLDPNEVDSENGWNAGHYCVSNPSISSGYMAFTWLVETYNMDCFGVYDLNGRSILNLAIENGRDDVVKYVINSRLGLKDDNQPWYELDLETIEKHINELQTILESLPENIPQQKQQIIHVILEKVTDQKIALTTYNQLFTN